MGTVIASIQTVSKCHQITLFIKDALILNNHIFYHRLWLLGILHLFTDSVNTLYIFIYLCDILYML